MITFIKKIKSAEEKSLADFFCLKMKKNENKNTKYHTTDTKSIEKNKLYNFSKSVHNILENYILLLYNDLDLINKMLII